MSEIERQANEILRHYPRIYVSCHTDHRNRKGQSASVTARDQSILAHIPDAGLRPQALAEHLNVAASTLSAALKRLCAMGLIELAAAPGDARGKIARLTARGRAAMTSTSVLDITRIRAALKRLAAHERNTVVRGLRLLADATQGLKS